MWLAQRYFVCARSATNADHENLTKKSEQNLT